MVSLLSESRDNRPSDAEAVLQLLDEIRHASNIDALIAAGENDNVEFKSSLHHPYGPFPPDLQKRIDAGNLSSQDAQSEVRRRLRTSVTKTIAAFLNTKGGDLLIGVTDAGTALGIESDLRYFLKRDRNADKWLLSLKTMIIIAFGPEVWSAIHVSLVPHKDGTVAVVHCPARTIETWLREDDGEHFYIRAANATQELHGSNIIGYIREHWPT